MRRTATLLGGSLALALGSFGFTGPGDEVVYPILLMHEADGRCIWRLADLRGEPVVVHEFPGGCAKKPRVTWHADRVARIEGKALVVAPWRTEGELERVPLPATEPPSEPGWVDGHWVVGFRHDASLPPEGDGKVFTTKQGLRVETDYVIPPFGQPAIVVFHRLEGGTWVDAGSEATRFGDGGMGFAVGPLRKAEGTRWSTLQRRCNTKPCPAPPAAETVAQGLGIKGDVGFLEAEGDEGWAFAVVWGDTPHAVGPVWTGREGMTTSVRRLEDIAPEQPISLHVHGGWLLASTEFSGANPRVYRKGQSRPQHAWPEVSHSAWFPVGVDPN